jgi:hypothetical protein
MSEYIYDKDSEISDLSMQMDIKVFKGGLGLLKTNTSSNNIKHGMNTIDKELKYDEIISFRSEKHVQALENIQNMKGDLNMESIALTRQIMDKLGSLKLPANKSKSIQNKSEYEEINKIFIKPEPTYEHEKEIKNFDSCNENNDDEEEEEEDEDERIKKEKNIFWNLKTNIEETETSDKNRSRSANKKSSNKSNIESNNGSKEIYLSSITCTLSHIEKGKAIFVSTDDFIFVLPALFVPRNLNVGNTYNFRISEFKKFKSKIINVGEIQKKYTNNKFRNINY